MTWTAHRAPRSARTAPVRPTPTAGGVETSLLLPAFWVVGLLLLAGTVRLATMLRGAVVSYPVATVTAMILFALYAVPFWLFVNALDYLEREPPVLLGTAFAWGAVVATSVAIPGSGALHHLLAKLISPQFATTWGSALAGPTVEELVKLLGVVAVVLVARGQVNSVLDGVVYGALVGLGFQVVEDVVFAVSAVALAGAGDQIGPVITTFFLRGFLAGLWSHTLFGALAGAGVGYAVVRTDRSWFSRLGAVALALAGAWLCHFVWNSPAFTSSPGPGGLWLLITLLAKGVPPLLMILLLVRAARGREFDYYAAQLTALGDPEVATAEELRVLGRGRLRADARRYAHGRAGIRGRHAVRRLQRAQARLAVELSRLPRPYTRVAPSAAASGDTAASGVAAASRGAAVSGGAAAPATRAAVAHWYAEVLAQRARLRALGHPEAIAPYGRSHAVRQWVVAILGLLGVLVIWIAITSLGGR